MQSLKHLASNLGLLLLCVSPAMARQGVNVNCQKGGQTVVVLGVNSTNFVMQSYPGCQIKVLIAGTGTLATIFADNLGTPLGNPFNASSVTGAGLFFADNGRYDIQLSGGNPSPGITPALTVSDILLNDPASPLGCSALPSLTGDVTSAGATCTTLLPNITTAGTGLKTTTNAKGQVTGVTTAASTDLSDSSIIARLNAAANFGLNSITGGIINGAAGVFAGSVTDAGETVSGEIAPDVTGRQLGDASHQWDAFVRNLTISGSFGSITVAGLNNTGNETIAGTLGVTGASTLGALTTSGASNLGTPTLGGSLFGWRFASLSNFQNDINSACNGTIPGAVSGIVGSVTLNPAQIRNNCTLKCPVPWACKVTLANAANANFFTQASIPAANIIIDGFIIDGNQSNQSGTSSCVYMQTLNGFHIRNSLIQNCHNHGIFVDGCSTYVGGTCTVPTPSQNVWIEDNEIISPQNGHGIELGNGPTPADTQVNNFHIAHNTILHSTSALVNGIFTLGAASVGVCGTGPGEITGNTINGATDTGIEVGQGSCQVTVTGNNVSLGNVNGTTGIGIRSVQEVAVTGNTVHGTSTNTSQICLLPWNNAGNDDLRFKTVTFDNNTAKGCNGNAIGSATYTSGGSITGSSTQTCVVTFGGGGGTGTVALTGTNTIAGGTSITITAGGVYTTGNAPTSATLSNGTATCSGTAVVSSTLSLTSFDLQVNAGNAGTAGAGDGLRIRGITTDGGPTAYNYLSMPANSDPQGNDDERYNSSRTKPVRSTQDTAGDGFYPYTSPVFQGSSPLNVEMRASNVGLPNGLYRLTVSGNQWILQRNTSALGDFSSASTEIGDDGSGNISIQQGQLIAQGIGGFRDTSTARFDEGTPGGSTVGADVCQGDSVAHDLRCFLNGATSPQNFPISIALHSTYTNATTTFSTISDGTRSMSWPIAANSDYTLDCTFVGQGSATTAGPKFQLTGPASPTLVSLMVDGGSSQVAYANNGVSGFSVTNAALGTLGATATSLVWHINASVANAANTGTIALQAAANGTGSLTISGGSCQLQ